MFSLPAFGGTPPGEILLEYVPGVATSAIVPILIGDQKEELTKFQGRTVGRITSKNQNLDVRWFFNVRETSWNAEPCDARLSVEYLSTGSHFINVVYDSVIHQIHSIHEPGKIDPRLGDELLEVAPINRFEEFSFSHTDEFIITKAYFANRCGTEKTDFCLRRWDDSWLGISRITLKIVPVNPGEIRRASSIDDLIRNVFSHYLERQPGSGELDLYRTAIQTHRLTIRGFMLNVMKSAEFIEVVFSSREKPDATMLFYKRFLGRSPSWNEMNEAIQWEIPEFQDIFIRDMIAQHYPEAIDSLFR